MQRLVQRGGVTAPWARPKDMSALIHGLLMQRGVASREEAEAFLHPSAAQLIDPMELSGMGEAVVRILRAREVFEDVCVFGDYDVDGVSASSLLSMFLRELGMNVSVYIPSRHEEGYGLNEQAVRAIFASKGRPADNPLIVHIAEWKELLPLCHPNKAAERLAEAFWPGPLTMILPSTTGSTMPKA